MHVLCPFWFYSLQSASGSTGITFPGFCESSQWYIKTNPQGPCQNVKSCVTGEFFHFDKLSLTSFIFWFPLPSTLRLIAVGAWITHGIFTQSAFIQREPRSVRTMLNTTLIKASQVASDQIHVKVLCAFKTLFSGLLIFKINIQIITVINSDPFSI